MYVSAIEVTPDPSFQMKGVLMVMLNDFPVFVSPFDYNFPYFQRFASLSLPLSSNRLERQGHVKLFIWNGLQDNSHIRITGNIIISDSPIDLSRGITPITSPVGSLNAILFNLVTREPGTYTQQFDMQGYKKMILLISNAVYITPASISNSNMLIDDGIISNVIDGDLSTSVRVGNPISGSTGYLKIDWGNIASRKIALKFIQNVTAVANQKSELKIDISPDDVTYTNIFDQILDLATSGTQTFIDTVSRNVRYVKITMIDRSGGIISDYRIYEMFDALLFGGTASLSFESLEPNTGQWIEIISASEIGTISEGQAISKQIGDTATDTNLNKLLYSDFASLRAVLTITNAIITIAVTAKRVP